jgi:hypothetical protein
VAETYVVLSRIPADGVELFQRYEDAVLPLLAEHGARLERRLRSHDGRTEVHVITFPTAGAIAGYRGDPRRLRHHELLERSGAQLELHRMTDVG